MQLNWKEAQAKDRFGFRTWNVHTWAGDHIATVQETGELWIVFADDCQYTYGTQKEACVFLQGFARGFLYGKLVQRAFGGPRNGDKG